ncbi:SDR family NAD(P)-dependent oxidoreductase [Nannocystaceae bacterium ST9]
MTDEHIAARDLATCLAVLEAARELAADDPQLIALERATAHLRKSAKRKRKQVRAELARASDRDKRATTGRWQDWDAGRLPSAGEVSEVSQAPPEPDASEHLHHEQRCYVCKQPYRELHFHYHLLCPSCAALNWTARGRRTDLAGRRALITGGRIKIGHELALKLLRDGAEVLVTTRFPRDAARRFAAAPDFDRFRERVKVIGVDLRFLPGVLGLAERLRSEARPLDILIHNAAQTVARPPAWQRELAEAEAAPLPDDLLALLDQPTRPALPSASPEALSALAIAPAAPEPFLARFHALCRTAPEAEAFPRGRVDEEQRPLDLRERNSWSLGLEEVEPVELIEAQLVNAIAPALLTGKLRPLLDASRFADRHVVFVSAVEGQFAYLRKTHRHPHTNMAKAALHMLTRTSADDWARSRIYMVSVDTGWVTQEHPEPTKQRLAERGFRPPLDIVDGAARVYDPIVRGAEGAPVWGCLLKDYQTAPW